MGVGGGESVGVVVVVYVSHRTCMGRGGGRRGVQRQCCSVHRCEESVS